MRKYFPHLLSFLVGYISLSQEILWVRIYGFANHSLPQAFGVVVVCYLVGIAAGAEVGKRFCGDSRNLWRISGYAVLAALAIDVACFYLIQSKAFLDPVVALFATPLLIALIAAGKAVLFPIAHHLGTIAERGRVGRSMSKVYVCNILGSTMGPLVTGLILLDFLTTQQCIFVLFGLTGLVSSFCFFAARRPGPGTAAPPGKHGARGAEVAVALLVGLVAFAGVVCLKESLYTNLAEKRDEPGPKKVIETKNGVVSLYGEVSGAENSDDAVLGGNVYDGRTNLDIVRNSNLIDRAVILAAVQPKPRRVLAIGLSIGTWLTLVDGFPGVESIDVVEINEGYMKAIENYPAQNRTLHDPRVHVYVDDANRWLIAHPDTRYDLVVMNTTYHWRNFASNLLSREFLAQLSRHMAKGAVLTYNSTEAPDVLKTASDVFPYARRRKSFILASDHDLTADLKSQGAVDRMMALQADGHRLFPEHSERLVASYIGIHLTTPEEEESAAKRPLEVITQDNMLTEYKYGRSLFGPVAGHFYRKFSDYIEGLGKPKGALEMRIKLPANRGGAYEPLVIVPNRDGRTVAVLINYDDATHIRIGYFQTGVILKYTDPIPVDYAAPHTIDVIVPAILPDYTDKGSYAGWSDAAIQASRQAISISLDGKTAYEAAFDFGERDGWYRAIVGKNTLTEGISSDSFSGSVLAIGRRPLLPPK